MMRPARPVRRASGWGGAPVHCVAVAGDQKSRSGSASEVGALGRHEAGLDGLRAVAVGLVLLYHGEVPAAKGGFLGISLFFTLSGFLITSILLRTHRATGRIALRTFWGRRYRRLLPAAYLTLAFVVLFGATVATRQQLADLPQAVLASILQVANWFFVVAGQSYVNLFAAPSPVQHFWSLAIEEQFYVAMPLLLIALLRRVRSMTVVAVTLLGMAVLSAVEMAVLYQHGTSLDRLYYGTDTRAAELLVGCALAAVLARRPLEIPSTAARRAWGIAGVGALAVMLWAVSRAVLANATLWRGGFFVFSLLAVVLIVSVLLHAGPVPWLLSSRPLARVGRISYGLYLFHWPVFLWLDANRTGLSLWPLLALRVAVTGAIAVASYHLLEMPIRNRSLRIRPIHLRWIAMASALAVLGGTVIAAQRNVPEQFGGLESAISEAPAARDDPRLDVLVITDAAGRHLADDLRRRAAGRADLSVTVAEPFGCREVVGTGSEHTCGNWRTEWPARVRSVDPDVVLFHVSDWDATELARLAGTDDPVAQADWLRRILPAGLDLLTRRGASIVWSYEPITVQNVSVQSRPFFQAMDLLTVDSGVLRLQDNSGDVDQTLAELSALRRPANQDLPRVLVVGDSSSRTFGYGLARWANSSGAALVWSVGTGGCGIARQGQVVELGRVVPIAQRCRAVAGGWRTRIERFRPDLVVVMSSIYDNQQRRLDGWPGMLVPGDKLFDDYLVHEYTDAYDVLAARGAKVVWVKSPCARPSIGPWPTDQRGGPLSTARIRHVNNVILPRVARARPELKTFDLFSRLCPDGRFHEATGGIADFRPDGIHYSPEASLWLARRYGPELLDAARG